MADLDSSHAIEFREFLICAALECFLKDVKNDHAEFKKVQDGFKVIETAFRLIDDDNSGTIDIDELKGALFETSMGDQTVVEERMHELDFDDDKNIEFQEFIYGFAAWVGFENDDIDDEEVENELEMLETTSANRTDKKDLSMVNKEFADEDNSDENELDDNDEDDIDDDVGIGEEIKKKDIKNERRMTVGDVTKLNKRLSGELDRKILAEHAMPNTVPDTSTDAPA
eukprot:815007_1